MNTENAGSRVPHEGKEKRKRLQASTVRISANLPVYSSIYPLVTSVLAYLRLMLASISFSFSFPRATCFRVFFSRSGAIVLNPKSRWKPAREKEKGYTSATRPVDRFFPLGNELSTRPFARSPTRLSMRIPRGDSRELDSPERRIAELQNFIWSRAIPMRPTSPSTCLSICLLRASCHLSAYHLSRLIKI